MADIYPISQLNILGVSGYAVSVFFQSYFYLMWSCPQFHNATQTALFLKMNVGNIKW
jgi:hypothetical protein